MKTALLLVISAAILLLADVRTASACSCFRPGLLESYAGAKTVIVGRAVSVEKSDDPERFIYGVRSTKFVVEKVFKGKLSPGAEMIFEQGGGGNCIWTFSEKSIGHRFLFYLTDDDVNRQRWSASICGRSNDSKFAAADLLYLENMARVRGKTRLFGTLRFRQDSAREDEEPINYALDGKRVRIAGEKKTCELFTNRDGVYEIYDLPAGKYQVEPEVPSGWKIERFGRENGEDSRSFTIIVSDGGLSELDFRYVVDNTIRGRVLDPAGNGLKDVCVHLLPAQGKRNRYFYGSDCTDKDGMYQINEIPPGSYIIVANEDGKISSSEPFRTLYYPNVFDREKAAAISIGAGYGLDGVDINVPKMEETITIQGIANYSDGKPVADESVKFMPEKTEESYETKASAQTDSNGRFSIKILKGLKGKLFAEMYGYAGKFLNCPTFEELVKQQGRFSEIRTNAVEIRGDDDVSNVELKYSFPACKKARE